MAHRTGGCKYEMPAQEGIGRNGAAFRGRPNILERPQPTRYRSLLAALSRSGTIQFVPHWRP